MRVLPDFDRRAVVAGALAIGLTSGAPAADRRIAATGLAFPEGLCASSRGMLFVEIAAGRLGRLLPGGRTETIAQLGGGPNGCAIGADGAAYVANNGGLTFARQPDGRLTVSGVPADYRSGSIQRVDLASGVVRTLYTRCGAHDLKGPNDIVVDRVGDLWFTDTGKMRARDRDLGGLYWARADGSEIREVAYPVNAPNGIALGADQRSLLVALQDKRQILAYAITGRGTIDPAPHVVAAPAGAFSIDNIALEDGGGIVVAAIGLGALVVLAPDGSLRDTIRLDDPVPTAVAFGGADRRTLYVTLSTTGRIVAIDWPRAGLPASFGAYS